MCLPAACLPLRSRPKHAHRAAPSHSIQLDSAVLSSAVLGSALSLPYTVCVIFESSLAALVEDQRQLCAPSRAARVVHIQGHEVLGDEPEEIAIQQAESAAHGRRRRGNRAVVGTIAHVPSGAVVGTNGCCRRRRRRLPMAEEEEAHTHLWGRGRRGEHLHAERRVREPMKRRRTRTQLSTRAVRRRVRSACALGIEHRLGVTITHAEHPSGATSLSTQESATSIAPSRSSEAGTCNDEFVRISSGSSDARYDALPSARGLKSMELRWTPSLFNSHSYTVAKTWPRLDALRSSNRKTAWFPHRSLGACSMRPTLGRENKHSRTTSGAAGLPHTCGTAIPVSAAPMGSTALTCEAGNGRRSEHEHLHARPIRGHQRQSGRRGEHEHLHARPIRGHQRPSDAITDGLHSPHRRFGIALLVQLGPQER